MEAGEAQDGRQKGEGEVRLKGAATAKLLAANKTCLTSRFLQNSQVYATLKPKEGLKMSFHLFKMKKYFFLTVLHLSYHLSADSWFPEDKSSKANSDLSLFSC